MAYLWLPVNHKSINEEGLFDELIRFLKRHALTDDGKTCQAPKCKGRFSLVDQIVPVLGSLQDILEYSYSNAIDPFFSSVNISNPDFTELVLNFIRQYLICFSSVLVKQIPSSGDLIAEAIEEIDYDEMLLFYASPRWVEFLQKHIHKPSKRYEEANLRQHATLLEKIQKNIRKTANKWNEDNKTNEIQLMSLKNDLEYYLQGAHEAEKGRLLEILSANMQAKLSLSKPWQVKVQELTRERRYFHTSTLPTRWKLDRRENYMRMRKRLTINYNFDDHKIASIKRDRSEFQKALDVPVPSSTADKMRLQSVKSDNFELSLIPAEINPLVKTIADNEWNFVQIHQEIAENSTETSVSLSCELIYLQSVVQGIFELCDLNLRFTVNREAFTAKASQHADLEFLRDQFVPLENIREVYLRRYLLRSSALEIFLSDQTTLFFNFSNAKDRARAYNNLINIGPSYLKMAAWKSPPELLKRSGLTEKWQKREISNFDYLMQLNTIAGRTFNDLSQYFIFPWILTNYDSSTFDLNDKEAYRDLSKPVGALDASRLQYFLDRYDNFDDPSGIVRKFMYGML